MSTNEAMAGVRNDIQEQSASMTPAERILAGSRDLWAGFHAHPFVRGIADGSLDRKKFEYFMIQDYLYLYEYAKVFSVGAAKAQKTDIMHALAAYVPAILSGEMDIHRNYMKRLGINPDTAIQTPMALDNLSYTSYMLKIAYECGPAEVCAAILPCAVSYEVVARKMVEADPECVNHPFYGEWIQGYAAQGYHDGNLELIELTNRAAENYNEEQIANLVKIGRYCSMYEGRFWEMSWQAGEADAVL